MSKLNRPRFSTSPVTRAVRAGLGADTTHRAVMPPIHLSTNFFFDAPGVCGTYDYTRTANPTRDLAAETIAELEGGCGAVVTSSGMSAIAVATRLLSAGDLLLAPRDCYGGSYRLFSAESNRGTYRVQFINPWDPESLELARQLRPRMIWIETPSNPHLRITDIAAWAGVARDIGRHLRGRQHLPLTRQPASAGVRRRPCRALDDEVPERAQRRGGRHGGGGR